MLSKKRERYIQKTIMCTSVTLHCTTQCGYCTREWLYVFPVVASLGEEGHEGALPLRAAPTTETKLLTDTHCSRRVVHTYDHIYSVCILTVIKMLSQH